MNTIYSKSGKREQDTPIMESGEGLRIHTSEYEAQVVEGAFQDFSEMIAKMLDGKHISREENTLQVQSAQYPNNILGRVKQEAISSIGYKEYTGSIKYITRKRPNQERSNTPGAEDAGIIFHGIDDGAVISPRRFIADSTGKLEDKGVSSEEVRNFFHVYGELFTGYEIISLGHLILACGSIARKEGIPTSGLMQANLILLTQGQVEEIMLLNSKNGNNNYTLRDASESDVILNPENNEMVPKLEAYRELLRNKAIN